MGRQQMGKRNRLKRQNQKVNSNAVNLNKRIHVAKRLTERYGEDIDFARLENYIFKSKCYTILIEDRSGFICSTNYQDQEIYFVIHNKYRGQEEIATFLTKEMAESNIECRVQEAAARKINEIEIKKEKKEEKQRKANRKIKIKNQQEIIMMPDMFDRAKEQGRLPGRFRVAGSDKVYSKEDF